MTDQPQINEAARKQLEAMCRRYAKQSGTHIVAAELLRILHEAETPEPTPSQQETLEALDVLIEYDRLNDDNEWPCWYQRHSDALKTVRRFIEQAGAVPEGWQLVPVEPRRDRPTRGGSTMTASPTEMMLAEIRDEVARARAKFPDPEASMCALTEEVGELAKALLDESQQRVYAEAIQVAATAIRVATEGDPSLQTIRQQRGLADLLPGGQ